VVTFLTGTLTLRFTKNTSRLTRFVSCNYFRKDTVYGTFEAPSVEQEGRSIGSVTWRLFAKYLKAGNGHLAIIVLLVFLVGCHALI